MSTIRFCYSFVQLHPKDLIMQLTTAAFLALACVLGLVAADYSSYGAGYGSYGGGYGGATAGFMPVHPGAAGGAGQSGILYLVGLLFLLMILFNNNNTSGTTTSILG